MLKLRLQRTARGPGLQRAARRQPEGAAARWGAGVYAEEAWAGHRSEEPLLTNVQGEGGPAVGASVLARSWRACTPIKTPL